MITSTTPLPPSPSFTSTSIDDFSASKGAASSRRRCHVSDFLHASRRPDSASPKITSQANPWPDGVISEFKNPSKPAACVRALACHSAKGFSASGRSWNFARRIAVLVDDGLFIFGRNERLEQTDYPESQR